MGKIQWTEETWNPILGCTYKSEGCKYCYAAQQTWRGEQFRKAGRKGFELYKGLAEQKKNGLYQFTSKLAFDKKRLDEPREQKKPTLYFVNSMSDMFHEKLPLERIQAIFNVMNETPQHKYQILTKRADVLLRYSKELDWTPNIWMGVSVENQDTVGRIKLLKRVPAEVLFISFEPLIGPITGVNLSGIHWAILGGESGAHARLCKGEWKRELIRICLRYKVAIFVKQLGKVFEYDGEVWPRRGKNDELVAFPTEFQIQDYPVTVAAKEAV